MGYNPIQIFPHLFLHNKIIGNITTVHKNTDIIYSKHYNERCVESYIVIGTSPVFIIARTEDPHVCIYGCSDINIFGVFQIIFIALYIRAVAGRMHPHVCV
jgi:hypothetical protein